LGLAVVRRTQIHGFVEARRYADEHVTRGSPDNERTDILDIILHAI